MSRGWKIALAVGLLLVVIYLALVVALLAFAGGGGLGFEGHAGTVAVIKLDGVIAADASGGVFSAPGIDPLTAADLIQRAQEDESVDALVLRVNSPGGSPAASWEVYRAIQDVSKPVVVSVGDLAASGAYYFSSAADSIVAAPTSQVGSIGVILTAADLQKLFDKVGVRYTVLTKGKYKDLGSPNREMTEEERQLLLDQMDAIYERFILDVAEGRATLEPEDVRELATGLTYPGEEALALGLIDQIGSFDDALDEAASLAGLTPDEYEVRYLEEDYGFSALDLLLGAQTREVLRSLGQELAAGVREGLSEASTPTLR
jgi:protease-4